MTQTNAVLEHALQAHGGMERWKKIQYLNTTWTFHGMMFKMRLRESQLNKLKARISTQKPSVEINGFLSRDTTSTFTPAQVEIHKPGTPARLRQNIRNTFGGLRTLLWWDDLEMLYFAGYVLWNYSQLPFLLTWPALVIKSGTPYQENGETWSRLDVTFPADFPAHSQQQSFFFDENGLLRRHDYYVAIMSKLARGARYIHSYTDVNGFKLPSRIEIKLRGAGNGYAQRPSLGFVDFDDMSLEE
jgi:hypothetical protein